MYRLFDSTSIYIVVIFIQLFNFLYLFFCFVFVNVVEVEDTHLYYWFRQITEYKNRSISLEVLFDEIRENPGRESLERTLFYRLLHLLRIF